MTWPSSGEPTTDLDAGTDTPPRANFLSLFQKFNQIVAHVSTFMQGLLTSADAASARATLDVPTRSGGNASGTWSITAANANNIALTNDATTNAAHHLTFADGTAGQENLKTDTAKLAYNPSTGALSASSFFGNGDGLTLTQKPTLGTAVTLTNQSQIDFTSIPSWAQRVRLCFELVSTSGTGGFFARLGTGGAPKTTDYTSVSVVSAQTNAVLSSGTNGGFNLYGSSAGDQVDGYMEFQRMGTNKWVSTHVGTRSGWSVVGGGTVTLSGPLDIVRLLPGAGNFDGGVVNIFWE